MRKIKYKLEVGYAGCDDEGVTEVSDDMTNEQIDALVQDMANEWAAHWEGDSRLCWDDDMDEDEHAEVTEYYYENVCGSWDFVENDDA